MIEKELRDKIEDLLFEEQFQLDEGYSLDNADTADKICKLIDANYIIVKKSKYREGADRWR